MVQYTLLQQLESLLNQTVIIKTTQQTYTGIISEIGIDYLIIKCNNNGFIINTKYIVEISEG